MTQPFRSLNSSVAAATIMLSACLVVSSAAAQDPELKDEISSLFDVGWTRSLKGRNAAREQFERLRRIAPADGRVPYAYVLVLIRQRQYADAKKHIVRLLRVDKTNLPAWKATVWLSMITRDYPAAMVEMEKLVVLLPNEMDDPQQDGEDLVIARYLGRMFGFLERAAGSAVPDAMREDHRRNVMAHLIPSQTAAFQAGRRSVIERYSQLVFEKDDTQEESRIAEEKLKAQRRLDLEQRRGDIKTELNEIRAQREKLIDEGRAEMNLIDQQERPLIGSLAGLQSNATIVQREMRLLEAEILRLHHLAEHEEDPDERQRLLANAARLESFLLRYDVDMAALDRQAAAINSQRAVLQRRRANVQLAGHRELARLDDRVATLRRTDQRIANQLLRGQLARPSTGTNTRVLALNAQATALSTYDRLPLHRERQRVLDSFE